MTMVGRLNYERTMKHANMAKRIAAIRLIMQGYFGVQVSQLPTYTLKRANPT
ncbi:hypothetical protein EDD69_10968 [Thermolongibacillus altinsuensis]|uniref:Uncharacterized protein n=1 Tax=Thermolongibacillus altinsuensis TaxID=575256 RepID=A0A4R1QL39_9BACL|nr:hypothetical protein [Thermolongibacillus altinsuensis]TCL48438.1 hypothetical protein EDD69_10968 [Thermolongibacillus altinsuensis]